MDELNQQYAQQDDLSDQSLIKAVRRRLLEELQRKEQEKIVNNIYGGQVVPEKSGIMENMAGQDGGDITPEDRDYFVDILRQNYDPGDEAQVIDPTTGQPVTQKLDRGGWQKRVHRFTKKKVNQE